MIESWDLTNSGQLSKNSGIRVSKQREQQEQKPKGRQESGLLIENKGRLRRLQKCLGLVCSQKVREMGRNR